MREKAFLDESGVSIKTERISMEFSSEEWNEVANGLKTALAGRDGDGNCFLKVIFRSNLGIYEKERMWVRGLENMGFRVDKVENLWSAASTSGLLVLRLDNGCIIMALWIIDEKTELVSIREVQSEDEITGILYSFSSSNIVSGVMRVFTYESIPDQNL